VNRIESFAPSSNNCVGEQTSNYLLRKTKFLLSYTGVRRTLIPPLDHVQVVISRGQIV